MSIHPSLRGVDTLVGERSVFTRVERLQKLMKEGKLTEEDSVYGLPKVRTKFKIKSRKKAKQEAAAAAAAEAGSGEEQAEGSEAS